MSEFTKTATITFEIVYESEDGESEFEFEKRVHKIVYYVNCKDVDYTLTIKELENGK